MTVPITHVRYVAQAIPEFDAALDFYRQHWGLTVVQENQNVAYLAAAESTEPFLLRLRRSDVKHLDLISFGAVDVATVDRIARECAAAGVRIDKKPGLLDSMGGGYGFRCFDPDGRLIEISTDVALRTPEKLKDGDSIPAKLSHIVINSPNADKARSFYEQHLGFRRRDSIGEFMEFFYIDSEHHRLAIVKAPHASFHHMSFEMHGLNEFLLANGRLARQGIRSSFGPGRHGTGDNTFNYYIDPARNVVEYTWGLQHIPEPESYPYKIWGFTPIEVDQWGIAGSHEEYVAAAIGAPDPLPFMSSPL